MRRYNFLNKNSIYVALNKLRAAFLAAKDGGEVDEIINGLLTRDERLKIGRRIQIAQQINKGTQYREISRNLKVGLSTVLTVAEKMTSYPNCYKLITQRENKTEIDIQKKAFIKLGGSKMIKRRKINTGLKIKNIKR